MHDAIGKFELKKKRDGYASESVLPKKDNILRCDGGARPYRARDTWRERESETVTLMLMMWVSTTNIGLVLTFTAVLYTIYLISINRLNGDKANIGFISAQLTYNFAAGIISFCWQLPRTACIIDEMAYNWKSLIVILTPLILLPLPLWIDGPEARAGYGILIITVFWITQAVPLSATALLPIVMFPFLDILSTREVCALYFKDSNFIFFSGVTLALGVEKSNLHSRIALRSVLLFGTDPRWLMLGLMSVGMLLSFWIPNSGLVAMLLPIVESVLAEILPATDAEAGIGNGEGTQVNLIDETLSNRNKDESYQRRVRTSMFLAVCYSVGFGGTGTLIASGAPIAMKGIIDGLYGSNTELNFATWMVVGVPIAAINTLLTWIWLQIYFLGCSQFFARRERNSKNDGLQLKSKLEDQYRKLGPMTYHEKSIITLFSVFILLCFFKKPQIFPGWQDLIPDRKIGDATISVAVAFLTFVLPANKPNFGCSKKDKQPLQESSSNATVLEWKYVEKKFPWGNIIIIGGSYAVADAAKHSGLTYWIGSQLSSLKELPPIFVMLLVCIVASMLTEITANSAASSLLLPIVAQIAEEIKINPLYLMMPVTISCSYAFMFPIGTPSNTMVFTAGKMKAGDMAKPGMLINVYTVLIVCAVTELIGTAVLDLHTYPDWANPDRTQMSATLMP